MVADGLAEAINAEDDLEVVGIEDTVEGSVLAAERLSPDVVLMDYRLRDGDGLDATRRIREGRGDTQVVMVTSAEGDAIAIAAIEAGCTAFVVKNSPIAEAVRAIRAAARGESTISPALLAKLLPRVRRDYQPVAESLTPREREVLGYLAEGLANTAIAERMVVSVNTVRNHVQNVLTKLDAHSKLEAVAIAVREGIIERT